MKSYFTCHDSENLIQGKGRHMNDKPTVLIVDDDRAILQGANLRLRASGFQTIEAHDGGEGVATAMRAKPDAIVMDVRMPRMDGLTALNELQDSDDTRGIPVVMLSASLIDQQQALEAGARFFVSKPYDGRDLVGAVQAAIRENGGGQAASPATLN